MTDQEILGKAAIKSLTNVFNEISRSKMTEEQMKKIVGGLQLRPSHCYDYIFSHEFAKGFWGEEKVNDCGSIVRESTPDEFKKAYPNGLSNLLNARIFVSESNTWYTRNEYTQMQSAWQYHLQQMVVQEEPLKYLEKFL